MFIINLCRFVFRHSSVAVEPTNESLATHAKWNITMTDSCLQWPVHTYFIHPRLTSGKKINKKKQQSQKYENNHAIFGARFLFGCSLTWETVDINITESCCLSYSLRMQHNQPEWNKTNNTHVDCTIGEFVDRLALNGPRMQDTHEQLLP